jgi:hypothetical protein
LIIVGLSSDRAAVTTGKLLSERDLSKFNKVIGKDMELIAACLGLSQVEIDRIMMENQRSMSTAVHKIFLTWKRKLGQAATLENLENSLQDAERDTGVHVDWELFRQAKTDLLKKRGWARFWRR